jgi:hypothetical protein
MKVVSRTRFSIDQSGFEDILFTESTRRDVDWYDAVKLVAEQGGILQSAREAVAFRMNARGDDNSFSEQLTRTTVAYFIEDGKAYFAVDDSPGSDNVVISYLNEKRDISKKNIDVILSKSDKLIKKLLKRAEKSERMMEIPEEKNIELMIMEAKDPAQNKIVRAFLMDTLESYSDFLTYQAGKGDRYFFNKFLVYLLDRDYVEKKIKKDAVIIQSIGIGGEDYSTGMYHLSDIAGNRFNETGYARGILKK